MKIELEFTPRIVDSYWSWEVTDADGTVWWGYDYDLVNAFDAARDALEGKVDDNDR